MLAGQAVYYCAARRTAKIEVKEPCLQSQLVKHMIKAFLPLEQGIENRLIALSQRNRHFIVTLK